MPLAGRVWEPRRPAASVLAQQISHAARCASRRQARSPAVLRIRYPVPSHLASDQHQVAAASAEKSSSTEEGASLRHGAHGARRMRLDCARGEGYPAVRCAGYARTVRHERHGEQPRGDSHETTPERGWDQVAYGEPQRRQRSTREKVSPPSLRPHYLYIILLCLNGSEVYRQYSREGVNIQ